MSSTQPQVVAIVQGRMTSSRLPGKILADLGGKPMLAHVVERVRLAQTVERVVVATTSDTSDDPVAQFCRAKGYDCFRGSLFDVLDRFYQTARVYAADVIVRITADCPLIDPLVIDQTVKAFFQHQVDFAANRLPPPWKRTFPIGLDTEVCSFAALERAWREAAQPHEREHVMPYLYEEEGRFKVHVIHAAQDYGDLRWTVDTPQDLSAMRALFALFQNNPPLSWLEVLPVWLQHPEVQSLNAGVQHHWFNDYDERFGKWEK